MSSSNKSDVEMKKRLSNAPTMQRKGSSLVILESGEKIKSLKADQIFLATAQEYKEQQEAETPTLREFISAKLNDAFLDNLPSEAIKDLGSIFVYIVGVLAYIILTGTFLYFFYTTFQQLLTTTYISLDPTSGTCVSVSHAVNGLFPASKLGLYIGARKCILLYYLA